MKRLLLILSTLFLASFVFSSCGDETYGSTKKVDAKKVTFLAQNTNIDQAVSDIDL